MRGTTSSFATRFSLWAVILIPSVVCEESKSGFHAGVTGFTNTYPSECTLSTEVQYLRLNETSGRYVTIGVGEVNEGDEIVKECPCTKYFDREPAFCPPEMGRCIVDGSNGPIGCTRDAGVFQILQIFLIIFLLWSAFLAFWFVFSERGIAARQYAARTVIGACMGESQAGRVQINMEGMMERNPRHAAELYRRATRRQRREDQNHEDDDLNDTNIILKDVLLLKTTTFIDKDSSMNSSSWNPFLRNGDHPTFQEMDGEMDKGNRCAICLERLRDGDTVGTIYCKHVMHKNCLKEWLARSNRCPLCQQPDIAQHSVKAIRGRADTEISLQTSVP